jgi:hypothetical protein
MSDAKFQLQWLGEPRLALQATSALPVWLWSTDATRIRWANPVGSRIFHATKRIRLARPRLPPILPQ